MKKTVKKTTAKKPMAKKPMMKSGGAKRSLRKYQGDEGGSEVGPAPMSPPSDVPAPAPSSTTTTATAGKRTFADAYKENLAAGLNPRQARKIAMVESGVKEQKKRIDPNAIINAVGNTAGAVGNLVSSVKGTNSGSSNPPFKKGGAKKCMQCGGSMKKMQKGGSAKVTVRTVSPNDPYEKRKAELAKKRAEVEAKYRSKMKTATAKRKAQETVNKADKEKYNAIKKNGVRFQQGGSTKPLGNTSARIGIGTVAAGAAAMAGKVIGDAIKRRKEKKKAQEETKKAKSSSTKLEKKAMGGSTRIVGMPQYGNNPRTYSGAMLKKGGAAKAKYSKGGFPDLTGDGKVTKADVLKGRGVIKKKGGVAKAKFGSSVPVQHSPAPGRVRSSSGVGTVPVGKRKKMGGATRRR